MTTVRRSAVSQYSRLVRDLSSLLESARRASARAINAFMTATYWEIGRRIVEFEQGGEERAEYGAVLLKKLAVDLTRRFGRGFSWRNLYSMRLFYLAFPPLKAFQTGSGESEQGFLQTVSARSGGESRQTASGHSEMPSRISSAAAAQAFPLPWSHYLLLASKTRSPEALAFYHAEALRGGWSVRQLDR